MAEPDQIRRVAVATDRSPGGDRAVEWAVRLASANGAELVAVQVVVDEDGPDRTAIAEMEAELAAAVASRYDGASALVATSAPDAIAETIVTQCAGAGADVIVIGNAGMHDRTEFLLGTVANRVTHLARCTVVIANSAGPERATPAAEEESDHLRDRGAEIARVLGPVMRSLATTRGHGTDEDGPRRLREAFEQLGPTFGKLGQILSTRPDLLPQAYLDELSSLQADVPPMAEEEVVSVMEQELGVPWEDAFATIDPEPLAAGTIGQVHRATLADGRRVVVKVQRPSAAHLVDQDLTLLAKVVGPLSHAKRVQRVIDLPAVVAQLDTALRAELDFRLEAENLERMAGQVARYPNLGVPGWHPELSTARLLVMDEIVDGVPVLDAPECPERSAAARQLLQSYYQQVLEDGFFHADPHPGNLLWADERIWLLDLGMVGEIGAETRRHLTLLLLAFAQGDTGLLTDIALALADGDTTGLDIEAYEADLGAIVGRMKEQSLEELQMVDLLNDLTEVSVRHDVALPTSLVMVGKAMGQVQLTVADLEPGLDPIAEAGRYFVRAITRRVAGQLDPQELIYGFEKLRYRFDQIGEAFAIASGGRPGRQLQMQFSSVRLEHSVTQAARMVALGLSAGLSWVAVAVAAGSEDVNPRARQGLKALAAGLSTGFAVSLRARR